MNKAMGSADCALREGRVQFLYSWSFLKYHLIYQQLCYGFGEMCRVQGQQSLSLFAVNRFRNKTQLVKGQKHRFLPSYPLSSTCCARNQINTSLPRIQRDKTQDMDVGKPLKLGKIFRKKNVSNMLQMSTRVCDLQRCRRAEK